MALAVLSKKALVLGIVGHRLANYWPLLLSTDLSTFYDVSRTRGLHLSPFGGLISSHVFSLPLPWLPPLPTNHPYVNTCGIDKKLSKMAGNSINYSLKRS